MPEVESIKSQKRIIEGVKKAPLKTPVKAPAKRKPKSAKVLFPDVCVQLVGKDGNAVAIMGEVSRALRRAGHVDGVDPFMAKALWASSYDEFLQIVMATVKVR
jgi:hypothetical protein